MKVDMIMPQMGESIAEATIIKWLKRPGEPVKKDEVILEISTDKVDSEIPAPASGVISETFFKEGDVVPVKERIAIIDTAASGAGVSKPAAKEEPKREANPEVLAKEQKMEQPEKVVRITTPGHTNLSHANGKASESDKFFSPLVKSLAEKHGVALSELESIHGSGHSGRITKEDFLSYVESRSSKAEGGENVKVERQEIHIQNTPVATRAEMPASRPAQPQYNFGNDVKIEPMDRMRQAIAQHMVMSKQTSPHVYSVQEVDMTNIATWRERNKKQFAEKEGFNLSFTPFFLEAAVKGLLEFPYVNASIQGNTIVVKKNINLGCAVALGTSGLIVPVIKRAEEKNLVGMARALNDLATRARDKALLPDDVAGGSFTVTNPGTFGTVIGYPIINQPQLAILSVGAIQKRAVVINDAIAIRQMVFLTLSYDHRLIDGALGGSYLAFVRKYLEGWDMNRPLY